MGLELERINKSLRFSLFIDWTMPAHLPLALGLVWQS
jgi:hypothetical protein